ncbi:MAG: CHAD domain-containing protein [Syntrophothermus sp.]
MSDRSYRLHGDEDAVEGMRRIARGRVERAAERLQAASEEDIADAIHGARKDLKKTRALLRLLRGELGDEVLRRENRRYREAGRLLSESRDAEVKLATLQELRRSADGRLPAVTADAWERMLEADRRRLASAGSAETRARVSRALALLAEGAREIDAWPLDDGSWDLVETGLDRAYREGRKNLAAVGAGGSDADVHELRKRAKDLWYQLRIVAEAWPAPLDATVGEAHALAELLGDHHDLSLLSEDLASRGGVLGHEQGIARLIAERQDELLESALAIGARLYAERPKAFRRRMRAYWRAWRGK